MQKLHKMLLAVVILAVITAAGTLKLSSRISESPALGASASYQLASDMPAPSCIWSLHLERMQTPLVQPTDGGLGDASDSCVQPSAAIPPSATASKLLGNGIYACTGRVSLQSSTKGHSNDCATSAGGDLNTSGASLLNAATHTVSSATDPTLDIPLNRGPTS